MKAIFSLGKITLVCVMGCNGIHSVWDKVYLIERQEGVQSQE